MRDIPDGIRDTLDNLFAGVLVGGIDTNNTELMAKKRDGFRQNFPLFMSRFAYNVFEQEYAVFYALFEKLKSGVFTASQLDTVLDNNTDIILHSKRVDLSEFMGGDMPLTEEEKYIAFKGRLMRRFKELSNIYVAEDEYKTSVEVYIDWYVNELALETAQKMTLILSDEGLYDIGDRGRKKYYKGVNDASRFYSEREAIWTALRTGKGRRDILIDSAWLKDELEDMEREPDEGLLDTGLEPIDESITKIRRGHLVNIVGQTKGGKTRLTGHLVQRALSQGLNVAVWALEGSIKEWQDCITANLIFSEYAATAFKEGRYAGSDDQSGIIVVDTDQLAGKKFTTAVEKEAVIAAKTKLATDYRRGRLSFIEDTCYVENFLDIIEAHYDNCNKFDVIVMDSPLVIQSKTGISERERIAQAFISLKAYIANGQRKPIAITTAQLKQEVIDELRRSKNKEMDVTAAGGSAEAVRTPDEVWGIFSSKESRENGQVTLESIASRHHGNFEKFVCACALGSCYFAYREELQSIL